jgi:hypothetical protein
MARLFPAYRKAAPRKALPLRLVAQELAALAYAQDSKARAAFRR